MENTHSGSKNGKHWDSSCIGNLQGRIVVVTGASSGIGLEVTRVLCRKGARVVMAVRNPEKGRIAADDLLKERPSGTLEVMELDLADLDSVKQFADNYLQKYQRLDILVNNAGVLYPRHRELTRQGYEVQFGVNYLGHFALTGQILELLKKTPGSRVVMLSSLAHQTFRTIHLDDLNGEQSYNKIRSYAQSKLANLLFTYELDRRFKTNGLDVLALAAHPGYTLTDLFRTSGLDFGRINALVGQNVQMGALPVLRAATEEHLTGSEYFGPDGWLGLRGYPILVSSSSLSMNTTIAQQLWNISTDWTGVCYPF